MTDESKANAVGSEVGAEGTVDSSDLSEPFACPNCGQMLAPTCHVCVACHEPIDLSRIAARETELPIPSPSGKAAPTLAGKTQFSWRIFLIVLGVYIATVILAKKYLNAVGYEAVLAGVLLVSSTWVFYDAHAKRVPYPFRWGISSLLLWIVVFPWYLSRRRAPEVPCPLMEAQTSVFIRALVWFFLIFFILSIIGALLTHRFSH